MTRVWGLTLNFSPLRFVCALTWSSFLKTYQERSTGAVDGRAYVWSSWFRTVAERKAIKKKKTDHALRCVHMLSTTYFHRLRVTKYEHVQHVDVGVFFKNVGLCMMLEMSMVPPVGRSSLRRKGNLLRFVGLKSKSKRRWSVAFKWPMINFCSKWFQWEFGKTDRWPKSCCSHPAWDWRRQRKSFRVLAHLHTYVCKRWRRQSNLNNCQHDDTEDGQNPVSSPKPYHKPGKSLQQHDVSQVEVEEQRASSEQTFFLCLVA